MKVTDVLFLALLVLPTGCTRTARPPVFEDYRVAPEFRGSPAAVNLSNPDARRFRTVLSEAASAGPNFADHLTVATWGCGTDCHVMAVVDARTGNVTFVGGYEIGVAFRRDSRLLVTNPPGALAERGWRFPEDCDQPWIPTTTYFEWDGETLRRLESAAPCAKPKEARRNERTPSP